MGRDTNQNDADRIPLRQWLCIEQLAVCCPVGTYGPECKPCQIINDEKVVCSGNGKCKGSGTRKGNGKCACDAAYTGPMCDECARGYHKTYQGISLRLYHNIHILKHKLYSTCWTFLLFCNIAKK